MTANLNEFNYFSENNLLSKIFNFYYFTLKIKYLNTLIKNNHFELNIYDIPNVPSPSVPFILSNNVDLFSK